MTFGLICGDMRLEQIAGDGRFRVSRNDRIWWTRISSGQWVVYPANTGQTYDTEAEAQQVADRLNA